MITLGMFTHDGAARRRRRRRRRRGRRPASPRFAVGDRVMGLFPEGTGTLVAADARVCCCRCPPDWSYAEAAGISAVFTTAYYGVARTWPTCSRGSRC